MKTKGIYILISLVLLLCVLSGCDSTKANEIMQRPEIKDAIEYAENVYTEYEQSIVLPDDKLESKENKAASNNEDIESDIQESIEDLLVPFDVENALSYCANVRSNISETRDSVTLSFIFYKGIPESDDDNVYLFEFSTYEDEEISGDVKPIGTFEKSMDMVMQVPFKERYLFSRFVPAILVEGSYIPLYNGQYITNPDILADNIDLYPIVESKKGILLDSNTIDKAALYDLNVKRAVYNIPLSLIIGETSNDTIPTIEYEYNGETYYFNGYFCAGYDSLFTYLREQGIHSTAIILNDWNKKNPEIMHPKSRRKTGKSLYYAFNTEEEDGVRLMEATAMFLAERYSGGEHGMVYDWVIANEINQHKIWNYMDTDDLDYYTESFEKSFRTFFNAIKAHYCNANVYFSIDHDFNDNGGNNRRFFNGRELLYKYNEYALKGGNYDWNLSIHPYPDPLTRVKYWNGSFDKTEEAGVITPMNLSSLTDVMRKEEMLDTDGQVREIAVTELGFSSKAGEKLQAAAFAYCYYIIENNEYINSFLLNRQTDDTEALKSGLALGIYNNDYSPKYIKDVFTNVDSSAGDKYIPEMLEIIGAESLEEALSWAE